MRTDIVMPKLGLTMTEGRIAEWFARPGDRIAAGAQLLSVETDKIVSDVEAPATGVLGPAIVPAGETVPVGTVIGHIDVDGVVVPVAATVPASAEAPSGLGHRPSAVAGTAPVETPCQPGDRPTGRVVATPYARRLARQAGAAIGAVTGRGPGGRIRAGDVLDHLARLPEEGSGVPAVALPAARLADFAAHIAADALRDLAGLLAEQTPLGRPSAAAFVLLSLAGWMRMHGQEGAGSLTIYDPDGTILTATIGKSAVSLDEAVQILASARGGGPTPASPFFALVMSESAVVARSLRGEALAVAVVGTGEDRVVRLSLIADTDRIDEPEAWLLFCRLAETLRNPLALLA